MSAHPSSGLLTLQSDRVRVSVDPSFGARVVSLVDRRTGREWMARGERDFVAGEDAIYGAREAAGWDECFPTLSSCDARNGVWDRRLRDHGDLWGRSWRVDAGRDEISATYEGDRYRFRARAHARRGSPDGGLRVDQHQRRRSSLFVEPARAPVGEPRR